MRTWTMREAAAHVFLLLAGLCVAHLGVTLFLLAELGSDPFNVLIQGLFRGIPWPAWLTHGRVHLLVSLVILCILLVVDRTYVRIGTVLCMALGGPIIDVYTVFLAPLFQGMAFVPRLAVLVLGCVILAFGMTVVIRSEAGTGPNDLVAVVLSDKLHKPFGPIRVTVDVCFAAIGWLLGGTLGLGTVVCAFLVGPTAQVFLPVSQRLCDRCVKKLRESPLSPRGESMKILNVTDPAFTPYGKVLSGYDTAELLRTLEEVTPLPEGVEYVPSQTELEALPIAALLASNGYGGMPIQLGWCNGHNTKLNCLEYHWDSEINVGTEDFILLVAKEDDIVDGHLDTAKVVAFRAPAGAVVEVYATTLHYAPCSAKKGQGFRVLVVLPRGTNGPKPAMTPLAGNFEDTTLWACNKWLLAHAESSEAAQGAVVALEGENIDIAADI